MSASLTIFLNGQLLRKFEIAKDRILIGRIPDNDLVLDHATVSRKHAAVVKQGDAYQLQDLGSSSGTYVNAKKVTSYFLNDGDEVSIGQLVLKFALPQPLAAGDSEMTMVVTNEDVKKQLAMMHQAALTGQAPAAPAQPAVPKPADAPKPVEAPKPAAKAPEASKPAEAVKPEPPPVIETPAPLPEPEPAPPKVEAPKPPVVKPVDAKAAEPKPVEVAKPSPPPVPPLEAAPKVEAPKPVELKPAEAAKPVPPPPPPLVEPPKPAEAAKPVPPPPPPLPAEPVKVLPPPPKPPAPPPLVEAKAEPPATDRLPKVESKADAPKPPATPEPAQATKTHRIGGPAPADKKLEESELLATVRGPFLGGQAKPGETHNTQMLHKAAADAKPAKHVEPAKPEAKPAEAVKPPAPPPVPVKPAAEAAPAKAPPAPPPPPQFPAESFEPTLISPPRKPPTPAPAPAAAMPPVPKTQDGKPDIAAIAFDAGVTVSPAAIGGLQKVHPPGAPAPAGGMPQTIPDRAPAPPPVPAGHAQPSAHTPQGQPAVTADQLLVPLHNRPKTQPMPPPVPAQPQAPAVQPLQPQQPAVPQPAPAARGGVAAPVFTQAAKDGWGEMTPPEAPTDDERQWGMLSSLLSLFCLIGAILGFIVKGQSKFVKFYCLQMLFLFVVTFAVNIVFTIAFFILAWIVPFLIFGMHLMSLLMMLAYLGAVVIQALKANQGMIFKLPLIGSFAYKLAYGK